MTNQLAHGIWMRFPVTGELPGKAYGLAGGLTVKPSPLDHDNAAGELWWGGVAGTQWWISPKANVAGVMMTQRHMAFLHPFVFDFKRLVYQAMAAAR